MTKEAALFWFWSSFGIDAYEETSVPTGEDAPKFPYITYQVVTDNFGAPVALSASVWDYSASWNMVNEKAREIASAISNRGALSCDGGGIRLYRGTPFAQNMGDETDGMIKRKYINVTAEFLTVN